VRGISDEACEVHVLTSGKDWLNLLWSLKTFYHYAQVKYRLCIHEDGSLSTTALETLETHFPDARILSRERMDSVTASALKTLPRSLAFRQTNNLSLKVFDVVLSAESDRILLLDSDLLFFERPEFLIEQASSLSLDRCWFNADIESAYNVEPDDALRESGIRLVPRLNTGLALFRRDVLRLDWFEEFLTLPGILGHFWRIEQTLLALAGSRAGASVLPPEYDVRLGRGGPFGPVRHYVGEIRHLMYGEGMRSLARRGFLGLTNLASV